MKRQPDGTTRRRLLYRVLCRSFLREPYPPKETISLPASFGTTKKLVRFGLNNHWLAPLLGFKVIFHLKPGSGTKSTA